MLSPAPLADWPAPRLPLPLNDGCAHVCRFDLDLPEERLEALHALLDESERARAARFRAGESRRRFIAARGQMREVLAAQLGLAPARLRLEQAPQGKPFVPGGALRFNLSHSGGLALLALHKTLELGVDLEDTRRPVDFPAIAQRFFAPVEAAALNDLPPAEQRQAFFRCWTRKEAYIKALGGGLAIPLASFTVTLNPGDPPRLSGGQPGWLLHALEPGAEYAAALVTLGAPRCIRCWGYPPG